MKWSDNRTMPPQKMKAGCWSTVLLILLALALLGCGIAEGVQRGMESADKGACLIGCRLKGMEFGSYVGDTDTCFCLRDDNEVKLY